MQRFWFVGARQRYDARLVAILGMDYHLAGHLDKAARVHAGRPHAGDGRQAKAGDTTLPVGPFFRIVIAGRLRPAHRLAPRLGREGYLPVGRQHDRARAPLAADHGQAICHLHQLGHFRIEALIERVPDTGRGLRSERLRISLGQDKHGHARMRLHQDHEVLVPHAFETWIAERRSRSDIGCRGRGRFGCLREGGREGEKRQGEGARQR